MTTASSFQSMVGSMDGSMITVWAVGSPQWAVGSGPYSSGMRFALTRGRQLHVCHCEGRHERDESELRGSDCMAEGHESRGIDLSRYQDTASTRDVWVGVPNANSRSVNPFEHRGGRGTRHAGAVPTPVSYTHLTLPTSDLV